MVRSVIIPGLSQHQPTCFTDEPRERPGKVLIDMRERLQTFLAILIGIPIPLSAEPVLTVMLNRDRDATPFSQPEPPFHAGPFHHRFPCPGELNAVEPDRGGPLDQRHGDLIRTRTGEV